MGSSFWGSLSHPSQMSRNVRHVVKDGGGKHLGQEISNVAKNIYIFLKILMYLLLKPAHPGGLEGRITW